MLARAHTVVEARVAQHASRHDLTLAEFGALQALHRQGPMLLGELQRHVLVSSGGMTYLVDRLESRGLVTRRPSPTDRRARFAVLTEDGQRLMDRIVPEHVRAVADAVDGMSAAEQRQASALLRALGLGVAEPERADAAPVPPPDEPVAPSWPARTAKRGKPPQLEPSEIAPPAPAQAPEESEPEPPTRPGPEQVAAVAPALAAEEVEWVEAGEPVPDEEPALLIGPETTILVVDDDRSTRKVAKSALAGPGREIIAVDSAADAERALARHDVALVVLSLVLPDADGRAVYTRLSRQRTTAAIPVIMVASKVGERARVECLGLGVADWFEKPIDGAALAKAANALLEGGLVPIAAAADPVTAALNRAAFAEAYEREVTARTEDPTPTALALLDLDAISAVNREHGRDIGDRVLRQMRELLSGVLRDTDVVARWRDDEFVVLFPQSDPATATRLLTRAQALLTTSPPTAPDGTEIPITFSAGIATASPLTSMEEAVATADRALSRAKSGGPSRVVSVEDESTETPTTVLVAEDDRVTATLVRHRLERAGFEVVHCESGTLALEAAEQVTFGLCISDIRMPGLDGFELVKRLRALPQYEAVPILMLTSLGREEDIVRAFSLGASDYMTKPFSPVELLARVQRLLRRRVSSSPA
ncbi:MAG: response regulator [Gemmatimonadota bacterium]|nr:response regulator [Gemmatimonadota bacterium]MDH3366876.1 response regulator [Gemmatimonadota bacterium]MDH3479536.1 response regulator [Gemmatimonadota bacterium]MDH3568732.1 response regulator [Gemmatimonadota bacterium]